MRVEVRALIIDSGRVAVVDWIRSGERRLSLPGGGVERWEAVKAALVREVREELGVEVEVGQFVAAFETVERYRMHDLDLVFAARLVDPADLGKLTLIHPHELTVPVFPPVLEMLAATITGRGEQRPWFGNVWQEQLRSAS